MANTPTSNLFHIVICELCHPLIQGYVDHFSSSDISEHFMTLDRVEPSELFESIDNIPLGDIDNLFITLRLRKRLFRRFIEHPCFRHHPSIRNYGKISNEITFSPQIAHCVELLPGEETVAIFALKEGVSEEKVLDWRSQLASAEEQGNFGFTSFPVLTEAILK